MRVSQLKCRQFFVGLGLELLFAVIWASFGDNALPENTADRRRDRQRRMSREDVPIGAASGFFGGIVASMNGVGIDMIIYAILALLYRANLTESLYSTARRVPHPVPER